MDNIEDINKNKPHYVCLALCLPCLYKWVAVIPEGTKVLFLECPKCGKQDSFVSILPRDFK